MGCKIKLKTLESILQDVNGFCEPKIQYEQYETPAHIAAVALYTIQSHFDALSGQLVLDAGCGTGMLSIGAGVMDACVTAVDIDEDALETLQENINDVELTNIDIVQTDFLKLNNHRWENYFDTVIMNPPFGTKNNAGIDMKFLEMGVHLSCDSVFSLHKTATRAYIKKKTKEWGINSKVVAELRYDLPATYKFHRQQTKDIAVDLWRLSHNS